MMLCFALARPLFSRTAAAARRRRPLWLASYSTGSSSSSGSGPRESGKSDPLRILFCGSDEFSCASLRALHDEHKRDASLIRSIDVVVRPSKPTGRGYKVLREVPLRALANQLQLTIHERDTFTGWNMPQPDGEPINLIIAVSFGLFVPPRLLSAAKYGGLNVHPSLLPDLRGPAPLHHALLAERTHTGVTVQTLSPEVFDAGAILLQTPRPGVPIPPGCTVQQLHDALAPAGASMLVSALRRGLHVDPPPPPPPPGHARHVSGDGADGSVTTTTTTTTLRHAPKIRPSDRQVRWTSAGAREVAVRARVLGPLWTHVRWADGRERRAILEDVTSVPAPEGGGGGAEGRSGGTVVWVEKTDGEGGEGGNESQVVKARYVIAEDGEAVVVCMPDGSWLRIGRIKVEGSTSKPARRVLERA